MKGCQRSRLLLGSGLFAREMDFIQEVDVVCQEIDFFGWGKGLLPGSGLGLRGNGLFAMEMGSCKEVDLVCQE